MREPEHKYIPGDPWGICALCGFKYRRSELRKNSDNLWVCAKDYEPRHPQESVQARTDQIRVKNPIPEPADVYITTSITQDDL